MATTITYVYPVTGATPPTAAQAAHVNSITVAVHFGASYDDPVELVHNWGLTSAQVANYWPWVLWTPATFGQAALPGAQTWATNSVMVYNDNNVAGTVICVLQRPHSMVT